MHRISEYIAKELATKDNYLNQISKAINQKAWVPNHANPQWFEDWDYNSDGLIDLLDAEKLQNAGYEATAQILLQKIVDQTEYDVPKFADQFKYMQSDGGILQKTLKDGKVFQGRNTNEIFVVHDDEFSSQVDDVHIIDFIAYQLNGSPPEDKISIKLIGDEQEDWNWLPIPLPYVKILGYDKKIVLAPDSLKKLFDGLDWQEKYPGLNNQYQSFDDFNTFVESQGFKPFKDEEYNLSDNTSQFLPVGVTRRKTSRTILNDEQVLEKLINEKNNK